MHEFVWNACICNILHLNTVQLWTEWTFSSELIMRKKASLDINSSGVPKMVVWGGSLSVKV